jgi:Cu/Ag efflux protein CusF
MPAWKVALLLNAALLLGLGGGYLWWGRQVVGLRGELTAARAAVSAGVDREYHGRGVVRAILLELGVIVLTHDDIPGYMTPMTMGFRAASPRLFEGIQVGDSVRFVLRGAVPNLLLVGIEKN